MLIEHLGQVTIEIFNSLRFLQLKISGRYLLLLCDDLFGFLNLWANLLLFALLLNYDGLLSLALQTQVLFRLFHYYYGFLLWHTFNGRLLLGLGWFLSLEGIFWGLLVGRN